MFNEREQMTRAVKWAGLIRLSPNIIQVFRVFDWAVLVKKNQIGLGSGLTLLVIGPIQKSDFFTLGLGSNRASNQARLDFKLSPFDFELGSSFKWARSALNLSQNYF